MNRNVSCVLCGAPITEPEAEDASHRWMSSFRALYTVWENWSQPRMSGVGRCSWRNVIPLDEAVARQAPSAIVDQVWMKVNLLMHHFDPALHVEWNPQTVWGFPLHDCCWHLLRLNDPEVPEYVVVRSLFDLCRSQPIQQHKKMDWGHDYAGLLPYELAPTAVCPGESAILRGRSLIGGTYLPDPINIRELQPILDQEGLELTSEHRGQLVSSKISQDPFAIFPHEILDEILTDLDSADVVSLLIASRMFASSGLPGKFWHSRFWPGKEFSHIFELCGQRSSAPRNWRRTYERVKAINDNSALENRRRIWSLASKLNTLIRARAQLKDCQGIPIAPSEGCESREPYHWNQHMGSVSSFYNYFTRGSRALYYRKSLLEGWIKKITISVNHLNGRTYICGLSFVHQQGNTSIGYHPVGRSGQQIDFCNSSPCRYSISSFEIARDPRGIRGIRILSNEDGWSGWIGDHVDLPKKIISCERSYEGSVEPTITIIAGFDASNEYGRVEDRWSRNRTITLWYPEIPDPCLHLIGAEHERLMEYRGALPHSVCMFGGPDGAWLPHLTEVIVWGIDRSSLGETGNNTLVFGIEFKYNKGVDDGRDSVILGYTYAAHMATPYSSAHRILIDSAGGERITGVDVMYQDPDQMAGFIVYTSSGRRREFPPHCKHYMQVDAEEDGCDSFSEELRPPSETCIVGLYSTLEHNEIGVTGSYDKTLMDLGLICAKKV
ncbi:unnamed protein product [Clonostachys byssicola]|uniref:DUF7600 domain-containing protein n=1 Tax=Clonostachys byssicola TaxID=160290 RepID=A0A9N9U7S6_9HYPO|nr:unnamed protein product [Clonostachys byssicola]